MNLHSLWTSFPSYQKKLSEVQGHILSVVEEAPGLINENLGILKTPGKMLRPAFVMMSAGIGQDTDKNVSKVAAAVELLHTATLIHDDVIDASSSRRNNPALHVRAGIKTAVLAGDFLFSKALELASSANSEGLVGAVNKGIAEICMSEIEQDSEQGNYFIDRETYFRRIHGKTAELFALSCRVGAVLGGAEPEEADAFYEVGRNFGIAFQIEDDVLDYRGSVQKLGKPVGNDLKDGIPTLPLILAIEDGDSKIIKMCRSKGRYLLKTQIRKRVLKGGYDERAAVIGEEYRQACIDGLSKLEFADKEIFIELINKLRHRDT